MERIRFRANHDPISNLQNWWIHYVNQITGVKKKEFDHQQIMEPSNSQIELDLNQGEGRRGISAMKTWLKNRPKLIHVNILEKWLCRLVFKLKNKECNSIDITDWKFSNLNICGWHTYLPIWQRKKNVLLLCTMSMDRVLFILWCIGSSI